MFTKILAIVALVMATAAPARAGNDGDVIAGVVGGMILGSLLTPRTTVVQPPPVYVEPRTVYVEPQYCGVIEDTIYSGRYMYVNYIDVCSGRILSQQTYRRW